MIFPTEAKMITSYAKKRRDVTIFFYQKDKMLFKRAFRDISSEDFKNLSDILDKIIEINVSSNCVVKFGIEEIQIFLKDVLE